jgi:protein tyrosine phosphatase (PTP) superfamily phosphohydrolase (DUF442 family)
MLVLFAVPGIAIAAELGEIRNYLEYSPSFASAGQPSQEQLEAVKEAGFERVIFIGVSSSRAALAGEDVIVKELGMDYIHVPVIFDAPTMSDFYNFAAILQREPDSKTLLHCAANFRASAFSFLYRVINEDVPVAEAKADMNDIWQPNDAWRQLIFDVLEDNEISPHCDGCSWEQDESN